MNINKSKPTLWLFVLSLCIAGLAQFLNRGGLLDRALEYGGQIPFCLMLFVECFVISLAFLVARIWQKEINTEACLALLGIGIVMIVAPTTLGPHLAGERIQAGIIFTPEQYIHALNRMSYLFAGIGLLMALAYDLFVLQRDPVVIDDRQKSAGEVVIDV